MSRRTKIFLWISATCFSMLCITTSIGFQWPWMVHDSYFYYETRTLYETLALLVLSFASIYYGIKTIKSKNISKPALKIILPLVFIPFGILFLFMAGQYLTIYTTSPVVEERFLFLKVRTVVDYDQQRFYRDYQASALPLPVKDDFFFRSYKKYYDTNDPNEYKVLNGIGPLFILRIVHN